MGTSLIVSWSTAAFKVAINTLFRWAMSAAWKVSIVDDTVVHCLQHVIVGLCLHHRCILLAPSHLFRVEKIQPQIGRYQYEWDKPYTLPFCILSRGIVLQR